RGSGEPLHLVSVAAMTQGKGHEVLVRALAPLRQRSWRLTCAGAVDRDPSTFARVRDLLKTAGLERQVSIVGELDSPELSTPYDRAGVLAHPSLRETYGMVVAEALARGLPVVASATGAVVDLVAADAGLVVPPADVNALSGALARIMDDSSLRERFSAGARRVRDRLPTWDD